MKAYAPWKHTSPSLPPAEGEECPGPSESDRTSWPRFPWQLSQRSLQVVVLLTLKKMGGQILYSRLFHTFLTLMDPPRQHIKKQRHYFANKGPSSQSHGFSSSYVWMWELDHKESWARKNWCFWTVVLEKTLESPLDCKEIKPVNSKGCQFWIFIERTDAEAETPILGPPDAKNWLIGKDPNDGKDWRPEEKGTTKDEMFGWHHQLDGQEFEQALGVGDGQGSLACCSLWGHKGSDMTEQLNWWTQYSCPPQIPRLKS